MANEFRRVMADFCSQSMLRVAHLVPIPEQMSALIAEVDVLRRENDELQRENEELRRQVDELSKLAAQMSEGNKACAFLSELPSMTTDDAELQSKIDDAFYTIQGDDTIWFGLRDLPHEEWRNIKGYEGRYQVSNFGRVKSFCRGRIKLVSGNFTPQVKYWTVRLRNTTGSANILIHRLVAQAFIPNPDGKELVNHKNGNKTDNRVENLEWVTPSENLFHAYRNRLTQGRRRLNAEQVRYVRENPDELSHKKLGEMFGVAAQTINCIICGFSYKHVK